MMNGKKFFIIMANVFIAVVLLQTYLRPFPDMILSGSEKKARPDVPSARDIITGKFQNSVETWMKQNIGFRGTFVKTDNQINYSLFNEFSRSHPRKIILGKDKQLFEEHYIGVYNKIQTSPLSFLENNASSIKQLQDKLRARNVKFLLILTPSKATIYPEFIPEKYILKDTPSNKDNYQLIMPMLGKLGINVLDGREQFLDMKKQGITHLFPSSGSHWSFYGAYLFGTKLIDRMEQLMGRKLVHMPMRTIIPSREPIELDKDIARLGNILFTRSLFTDYRYPETYPDAPAYAYRPAILLVGSSFCWNLIQYLEQNQIYSRLNFYYYFNTDYTYPGKNRHAIDRANINWNRDVLSEDIIIIEINESQINEAGFGFIEKALAAISR